MTPRGTREGVDGELIAPFLGYAYDPRENKRRMVWRGYWPFLLGATVHPVLRGRWDWLSEIAKDAQRFMDRWTERMTIRGEIVSVPDAAADAREMEG